MGWVPVGFVYSQGTLAACNHLDVGSASGINGPSCSDPPSSHAGPVETQSSWPRRKDSPQRAQRAQRKALLLARLGIALPKFVDPQFLSASVLRDLCGLCGEMLLGLRLAPAVSISMAMRDQLPRLPLQKSQNKLVETAGWRLRRGRKPQDRQQERMR